MFNQPTHCAKLSHAQTTLSLCIDNDRRLNARLGSKYEGAEYGFVSITIPFLKRFGDCRRLDVELKAVKRHKATDGQPAAGLPPSRRTLGVSGGVQWSTSAPLFDLRPRMLTCVNVATGHDCSAETRSDVRRSPRRI